MVLSSEIPANVADDINALYSNYQQEAGLSFAVYTSLNRATGALQAGMTDWQYKQIAAADEYANELGAAMSLDPTLSATLQQDLAAAGITIPTATAAQVYAVEQNIQTNGLSADEQAVLAAVGLNSSEQQQAAELGFVQSTTDISALLSSTDGSAFWENAAFNSDILAAASSFSFTPAVSTSANPQTFIPPKVSKFVPVTISGTVANIGAFGSSGSSLDTASYSVTDEYGQYQPQGTVSVAANGQYSFTLPFPATLNNQNDNGRSFVITVGAKNSAGNSGSGSVTVTVVPQITN